MSIAAHPRVVVIGSFNVDHVWAAHALPQPGETLAGTYSSGPGGKGFNQAIAARRAGAEVSFLCALGDDLGAQLARALATADGIDLRDARSDAPTGTAGIFVDAAGRNCIVIGAGSNASLDADCMRQHVDAFVDAQVVLAQLEVPAEAVLAGLQHGRAHGATCILNPAPANAHTTSALLQAADILTPNETEFAAMLARHAGEQIDPDHVAHCDPERLHGWCRSLAPHASVVITLGGTGCFASHASGHVRGDPQPHYFMPAEPANVVDTTGAGDAFNGALTASLASRPQLPFARHLAFAGRYAARSTELPGAAMSMPRVPVQSLT